MLTLAFESSAKAASVALCDGEKLIAQTTQNCGLTHSVTLLPMAQALLKNSGYDLRQVELFAVAHGPGSFTGIRIGVSAVKGLAWAVNTPAVGVSTLKAMAYQGLAFGEDALLCCVMDARRNQVYNALFTVRGGKPERLCPDRAVSLEELAGHLRELGRTAYLIGDGAALTAEFLRQSGVPAVLAPEPLRTQSAWGVAQAALEETPGTADDLLPVYLRLSQAERERQERMSSNAR
jgi:tRNA threonylcarbamoyladenosine biosynthesis protein TsaB